MFADNNSDTNTYYTIDDPLNIFVFVAIKNGFGSFKDTMTTPINEVLDYYNYIIFLNELEREEYNKLKKQ